MYIRHQISVSVNYRAITHSCIFGKVLDKALLNTQRDTFKISEMQYGLEQNNSTATCCSMVIQTIEYYVS